MPSHAPRDPSRAPVRLLVGPGVRAEGLARVLAAIGAPGDVEARAFGDVATLGAGGAPRLLLLDADAVPLEDVGYVRRFLTAHPTLELVAFGGDPRARAVRALGSPRFAHWPPDVEELTALVALARAGSTARARTGVSASTVSPAAGRSGAPAHTHIESRPSSTTADMAESDVEELEEVRAILEQSAHADPDVSGTERRSPSESTSTFSGEYPREFANELSGDFPGEFAPDFSDDSDVHADAHAGSLAELRDAAALAVDEEATLAPTEADLADALADSDVKDVRTPAIAAPPWWRAQVADLADAAQRIDLSVKMLAQAAPEIDEGDLDDARSRLRELEAEVARLLQFTRTLGYVAAPPPTGSQTFDLGEIVHLFATGLAQSGPQAPRCQFKATPNATVRSDRQLLSQALDAVFFLVRCTARKGDLVRARVQLLEKDGGWVELDVDFPSGPLEGLVDDDIVSPYSLSDLFPELGPNALAAATGIVAGQGGELRLASRARGRMTWHLRLPHWTR